MSRSTIKKLLFGVAFAAILYVLATHPYSRWRVRLLAMKLTGRIPQISWSEIPAELEGPLWFERKAKPGDESRGLVVLERREEGPCGSLWKTPIGSFWGRQADENVLEWLAREQYIWSIYQNSSVSIEEGDVVLDVGSHLGVFTRTALNSGARKVVGFEPEPINISCFKKTFKDEIREGRVVLVEAAAWDSVGALPFTRKEEGVHQSARARVSRSGEMEVPSTSIDVTVEELGLERVDFIKMDIEGSERYALRGARNTLSRFRPKMALCIYHRYDDAEVLPREVLNIRPDYHELKLLQYVYFY